MSKSGRVGRIVAAVIIVLVMLVIFVVCPTVRRYETLASGLWVGDPEFLRKANLSDMQLYIAPRAGRTMQGYIIITDTNGEFIANKPFEISLNFGNPISRCVKAVKANFATDDKMTGKVRIEMDGGDIDAMPSEMRMGLSLSAGSMTLFNDEKVFAFLYKDLVASHAAKVATESKEP